MLSFSGPFSCSSSSPDVLSKSRYNHYSLYSQVSEWYQLIFEQQRISENPFACTIKVIQKGWWKQFILLARSSLEPLIW